MFFKGVGTENASDADEWQAKPTIIVCNSNAMFYQQMVHQSHSFYLRFFIDKGINVFIWNYRGYGRSKGKPSPEFLKHDIKCVFYFLINEIKVTGKIGVYGRSLGGIPSCHISPYVDLLIVDRSFCNLKAMANIKLHSNIADYLFKIGSCGWQS